MRILSKTLGGTAVLAVMFAAACGDDGGSSSPPPDTGGGSNDPGGTVTYHQVEQLARPAINEALLFTTAYLDGYNATAPTFTGVPKDTLDKVVGEAKTVLEAIYLGSCLLNGLAGVTADTGVHPAGMTCHAIGNALFNGDQVTLTQASKDAAKHYADTVFGQFIPDVLRIDTGVDVSNYLNLCGGSGPLLCGGRWLTDDTVDITYNYLINGANNYLHPENNGTALGQQLIALSSDGVTYSKTAANNRDSLTTPAAANAQQGHPDVSSKFPYSAAPF